MLTFRVPDMTCGHCASAITQAVQSADPGADVQVDLARRTVQIQPVSADADRLQRAVQAAGYRAELS